MNSVILIVFGGAILLAVFFALSLSRRARDGTRRTAAADGSSGGDIAWMSDGSDGGHAGDCGGDSGSDSGGCDGGGDGGGGGH